MMSRRTLLSGLAGFAAAATVPQARAATTVIDYTGPDDPAALAAQIKKLSQNKLLLVSFYAPWCPHCKTMFQYLDDARAMVTMNYAVLTVNVDNKQAVTNPNIRAAFPEVRGFPTTKFFHDNNPVRFYGWDEKTCAFDSAKPAMVGRPESLAEMVMILRDHDRVARGLALVPGAGRPCPVPKN